MDYIHKKFHVLITNLGISEVQIETMLLIFKIAFAILIFAIVFYTIYFGLKILAKLVVKKYKYGFYPLLLVNRKRFLLALASFLSVTFALAYIYELEIASTILVKALQITETIIIVFILTEINFVAKTVYKNTPHFINKPIDSYIQILNMIIYILATASIYVTITNTSVMVFFTSLGAMSAVLMLVFKDTILGIVASIQITSNDMARVGDWITIDKYGADGDIIEINLTTVKVQNWDNTITTVPIYALISDSFQNWRGMADSGCRRIKRYLRFGYPSIHYLTKKELEQYNEIELLKPYIAELMPNMADDPIEDKDTALVFENNQTLVNNETPNPIANTKLVNSNNPTNLTLFRYYIEAYLRAHKGIAQNATLMVRQLQPMEYGIPLEVYCFTSNNQWVPYENIQSDIFDHLYAAAYHFDLKLFQR